MFLIVIQAIYYRSTKNYIVIRSRKKLLEQIQVKDTITRPDDEVCMPHEAKRRKQEEVEKKKKTITWDFYILHTSLHCVVVEEEEEDGGKKLPHST